MSNMNERHMVTLIRLVTLCDAKNHLQGLEERNYGVFIRLGEIFRLDEVVFEKHSPKNWTWYEFNGIMQCGEARIYSS